MKYKIYDAYLDAYDEVSPKDYAEGMVWDECEYEITDRLPIYCDFVETVNGVSIYYSVLSDDYMFVEKVSE